MTKIKSYQYYCACILNNNVDKALPLKFDGLKETGHLPIASIIIIAAQIFLMIFCGGSYNAYLCVWIHIFH
jgi:hypothetical protein